MNKKTSQPDYLGIYTFPTCYSYCDKTKDDPRTRDYIVIGRLFYNPLRIEIFNNDVKYKDAHEIMKEDFESLKNVDFVQVSTTGQTQRINYLK